MSFAHGENLLKHTFLPKWGILNSLRFQKLENANFSNFFTCPLGENYSNSSFVKSKGLNNQKAEEINSICSNHIFEPTLSNHFLQIDVDLIEKLIPCSLQGGPFGGPACPPVFFIFDFESSCTSNVWKKQKIIKFAIFIKNGGSTVDPKNQPLESDWAKKLIKKDTMLIFFQRKLRCCFLQFWCQVDTRVDTWTSILLWNCEISRFLTKWTCNFKIE